ncbi:MAG TPA: hypothetical protein VF535_11665 [Allosphingosinicella sp.]
MRRALLALLIVAAPASADARPTIVSPAPESVSVTVYRNPDREPDEKMDPDWLEGFALITETRTLELPAGESEIRFEGVAGGIIPASVIVAGLPGPPGEKNRDARLLSPGALVDAALGRRVHIRRTSRATGKVTETEALIRSGPDGIVVETAEGVEALRCGGLPETLVHPEVPEGLSDKPTLAVTSRGDSAARVTVRLSYLATDFDWQADYVASIRADGRTLDLFAWLTLANGNDESFPSAQAQAVAGSLNREEDEEEDEDFESAQPSPGITLQCWPQGTTSDVTETVVNSLESFAAVSSIGGEEIVVTGSRIPRPELLSMVPVTVVNAELEELGDLKLYRIPEPVTVAAKAQKQIALLTRERVPFRSLYGYSLGARGSLDEAEPAQLLVRMKNTRAEGLGLPLPTGGVALFEEAGGRPMLVGEGSLADTAVGQDVELAVGESADVRILQRMGPARPRHGAKAKAEDDGEDDYHRKGTRRYEVEVGNATSRPAEVEVVLRVFAGETLRRPSAALEMKNGRRMWRAHVPANGRSLLTYDLKVKAAKPRRQKDDDDDDDDD